MILRLAEIRGLEQLLEADDLRPFPRRFPDTGLGAPQIGLDILDAGRLDQADIQLFSVGISGHNLIKLASLGIAGIGWGV